MSKSCFTTALLTCAMALVMLLSAGCGRLLPKPPPPPRLYSLEAAQEAALVTAPSLRAARAVSVILNPPRAAAGYDSQHIVYVELAHERKYFAHNEWVATPARMLLPIMMAALEHRASFSAVAAASSGVAGDLRLDTEILRLQQEFGGGPSRVRFSLRATLSDNATREVIAWREFDETVASASEDPYGGVVAANRAVQELAAQVASFCAQAADTWRAATGAAPKPGSPRAPLN